MSRVIIVDQLDNIIDYKNRDEMSKTDIYRVSCLWLTNSKNQVLISKRVLTKKHNPGKWEPAVAGTLEEGDTYESNIIKETKEEIGLIIFPKDLVAGPKVLLEGEYKFYGQFFYANTDKALSEFTIQKEEVAEIAWRDHKSLLDDLKTNPTKFVPNFGTIYNLLNPEASVKV